MNVTEKVNQMIQRHVIAIPPAGMLKDIEDAYLANGGHAVASMFYQNVLMEGEKHLQPIPLESVLPALSILSLVEFFHSLPKLNLDKFIKMEVIKGRIDNDPRSRDQFIQKLRMEIKKQQNQNGGQVR